MIGSIIAFVASGAFLSVAYYPHVWTTFTFATILFICMDTDPAWRQDAGAVEIPEGELAASNG
jgi:hypothetical protein